MKLFQNLFLNLAGLPTDTPRKIRALEEANRLLKSENSQLVRSEKSLKSEKDALQKKLEATASAGEVHVRSNILLTAVDVLLKDRIPTKKSKDALREAAEKLREKIRPSVGAE